MQPPDVNLPLWPLISKCKNGTCFYSKANNASTLKGKNSANHPAPGRREKSPANCIFCFNSLLFIMMAHNRKCELRK